ncbi:tripartite tricarboxylate transporter substrate-binding protein [Pigmentiphaga sp. GD03639]|uniref:Tripartite tricarboxylate transporter substrate binding protein n=1 Tax=Pigmentiphaga daeguensis TaxID=414049 RepID=A0ABP3MDA3_9BURK|nr:tripartite tricarboxylate transporter substrate-binding protein [Pigmentiphaga sp. GD03639]MDH2239547.1 tripartite tricarboxylate transporter substrate-binding protein [Pigmentiphaga sp. GD03639]
MHRSIARCALAALFVCASAAAQKPSYPDRPVRVVVPYGPGTAPDLIARVVSEQLSRQTGQSFVVENKLGAGGKIGTEAVADAKADGYTLLLGGKDTHGILTHLYPDWRIKPEKDFAPVALLARIQNVLLASPKLPASNPQEFLALARQKELRYGTPGVGTNLHLAAAYLQSNYGLKLLHIPYSRSFAEALPALARGELDLVVAGLPPAMPLLKDGRIKAIAVTGTQRSRFAPDIPTFAESGVSGLESGGWFALFAPTGTPQSAVDALSKMVATALREPAVTEKLSGVYADPAPSSPAELAKLVADETQRWGKVVAETGIKLE